MSNAQPHAAKRALEILAALEVLGGRAHYLKIAGAAARARRARGEPVAKNIAASIRNGLQRHCSQSPHYGGHTDLFRHVGNGIWELISRKIGQDQAERSTLGSKRGNSVPQKESVQ